MGTMAATSDQKTTNRCYGFEKVESIVMLLNAVEEYPRCFKDAKNHFKKPEAKPHRSGYAQSPRRMGHGNVYDLSTEKR